MQRNSSDTTLHFTDDGDIAIPLNAVIAYDDVSAGHRAMSILADLTAAFADAIDLHPQAWRLDLLENPYWRGLATADVIKADMVIVSISSGARLSPIIESWVEACLARKRGAMGAVVALGGAGDDGRELGARHFEFLKHAADKVGLDFFSPLQNWGDSLDSSIEGIHRRAETVTETLHKILHRPPTPWHLSA